MVTLTKIYTRQGDAGLTSLGAGRKVPKNSLRVQSYGTVDELNSQIGVAIALDDANVDVIKIPSTMSR